MVRNVIMDSHSRLDSVFRFERIASDSIRSDQKYAFESRGRNEVKQHSREFISLYENELNGMVERQLRASIKATGDLWYSSWIEAGQPDLSTLGVSKNFPSEVQQQVSDSIKSNPRTKIHY